MPRSIPRMQSTHGTQGRDVLWSTTAINLPVLRCDLCKVSEWLTAPFAAFSYSEAIVYCFFSSFDYCYWFCRHRVFKFLGVSTSQLGTFCNIGTIVFAPLALAELNFQCVEIIAAKFSHQSNHYWAAIVLLAMFISNQVQEATAYLVMFFIVMLIRWFISGLAQFRESSHETHFNN